MLCLLAACASESPEEGEGNGKRVELSFAVSDFPSLSRASTTGSFDEFAICGDMKPAKGDVVSEPMEIFNNDLIEYRDERWRYDNTRYLFPDYEHSFVAVYPVRMLAPENVPEYSASRLSFVYTLPTSADSEVTDYKEVEDILAATHRRFHDGAADQAPAIDLKFSHVMTRINLYAALDDNVMTADEVIKIRRIEFSGFKTRGTFSITPAQRNGEIQTDSPELGVTDLVGEGRLTIGFDEAVAIPNREAHIALLDDEEALIMLPQEFGSDSDAEITVTYTIDDNPAIKQGVLPLRNRKWESGKSYSYKFTINLTGAHFDSTTITDWDRCDAGTIEPTYE